MSGKHHEKLRDQEYLREMYEVEHKTTHEMADVLGCSFSSVARALHRAGVPVRGRVEGGITEKPCERPGCGQVFPVGRSGQRKRSARFCSRACMYQVVKPPSGHGSDAPRPKKNKDTLHKEGWLRGKYIDDKMSAVDIAVLLNCSVTSVCHALAKFRIPVRTMSEAKAGRKLISRAGPNADSSVGRSRQRAYRARQALKAEMVAAYGGCCACCGEAEIAFLTIDHVMRNGKEHRQQIGGQSRLYKLLKAMGWPKDGYRCLCMNCNFATRLGEPCPHQSKKEAAVPPAANPTPGPKAVPIYGKVVLKGTTFGSRMDIVLRMEKGGLYKGEVERIIGDMMDQIAAGNTTTRWEHFEFDGMYLKRGDDGGWVEVERDKPKGPPDEAAAAGA